MDSVADYNELDKLTKRDGREVLVIYSLIVYRVINGEWRPVGRVVYRK